MWNKILGGLLILGIIFAVIFSFRFFPIYSGVNELEANFNTCLSNFRQYRPDGCRALFGVTIENSGLSLTPEEILIEGGVQQVTTISAEWTETIDFFGVWQYEHTFSISKEGTPPDRN